MTNINIFIKYNKLLKDLYSNKIINKLIKDDYQNYIIKYKNIEKKKIKSDFEWIFKTLYSYEFLLNKYNNLKVNLPFYDEYLNNGYIVIKNFLNEDEFKKILNEVNNVTKNINSEPSDVPFKIFVSKLDDKNIHIKNFFSNEKLNFYLKYCSFLFEDNIPSKRNHIEILKHTTTEKDIQKTWHIDTFHDTCKWWFYLEDILDDDKGAFEYIKGSNKNTLSKLKYEQKCINKIQKKEITDKGSKEGSLRYYNDKTIKSIGYKDDDFIKAKYKKNTLFIVNTHGIHRRGHGKFGTLRLSLASSIREDIFI